jgi:hypothetical protein
MQPQYQTVEYQAIVAISIFVAITSLIALIVALILWRRASVKQSAELESKVASARELEKQLHIKDRDFLEERNRIELSSAESLRAARAASFEEGRQLGLAESQRDHVNELVSKHTELCTKFEIERKQAVEDAKERLRAEYELQTKLFTVKISPYVKITQDKGLFGDKYEAVSGYQYQLLVNGIPAFSPHFVPERTETNKAINAELELALIDTAKLAADSAITLYLGGISQFAQRAPLILERLTKK